MSLRDCLSDLAVKRLDEHKFSKVTNLSPDAVFAFRILVHFRNIRYTQLCDILKTKAGQGRLSFSWVYSMTPFWESLEKELGTPLNKHNVEMVRRYPPESWIRAILPVELQSVCTNVTLHKNLSGLERSAASSIETYPFYEITFEWGEAVKDKVLKRNQKRKADALTRLEATAVVDTAGFPSTMTPTNGADPSTPMLPTEDVLRAFSDAACAHAQA